MHEHRGLHALVSPSDHILPKLVVNPRCRSIPNEVLHDRELVRGRVSISVRIEWQERKIIGQAEERTKSLSAITLPGGNPDDLKDIREPGNALVGGHSDSDGVPGDGRVERSLPAARPEQSDHAIHIEQAGRTLRTRLQIHLPGISRCWRNARSHGP